MKFNTDIYFVKPEQCFGGYINACWKLWFTEAGDVVDRQHIIECHTLPVKPTKRQVRKLRRAFRKAIQPITAHEEIVISVLGME